MNRTFRVLLRSTTPDWKGRTGQIVKKRIYVSFEDFSKYACDTIEHYTNQGWCDVEEFIEGKWKLISSYKMGEYIGK